MKATNKNRVTFGLDCSPRFGKHKGKSIEYIIIKDPRYIEWCISEGIFILNAKAAAMLEEELKNTPEEYDYDYYYERLDYL